MTDEDRVAVRRYLTDQERDLLAFLTTRTLGHELGWTDERAAEALEELASRGEVIYRGDELDAYVAVGGRDIVHCTREWLSFIATAFDAGEAPPAFGSPIEADT